MKPTFLTDVPLHDQSLSSVAKSEYDFAHSDSIDTLSYDEIIDYFGGREAAISYYHETLTTGFPRSAAFIMSKIIKGCVTTNNLDYAERTLLKDLSGLSKTQMATAANSLITKVKKPTNRKKVMFSSAHWLTGGMERVMSTLFRELENDYEIFLITPYSETPSSIEVPDFVTNIKINSSLFVRHFDSLVLSYALLFDIDVVIGYMNLFEKQLNFYNLCEGTSVKTIASNHEYYFYPYKSPPHYKVVAKRLESFSKCQALVWPLNFNAALCGLYVDNNYVIGNPNNFEISQEDQLKKDNVIICVGRFNDYVKRIDRILQCFSMVLKDVPEAKLLLVGKYEKNEPIKPGDATTVNDLIAKLSIPESSISFLGEVNNVEDYYKQAKVLILTSNSEGFGMVLNEAACFGVPSVCNYIPGIEDIITNGENGFIVEQNDIDAMASKVCEVLINDDLHNKLSMNAKKKVVAYDSKHIGNKWRHLIDALTEIKDENKLRQRLGDELGYKAIDEQRFSKTLSNELNEIFYGLIGGSNEYDNKNRKRIIASKFKRLPKRLKANIAHEGVLNTGKKVTKRSYRIARKNFKKVNDKIIKRQYP